MLQARLKKTFPTHNDSPGFSLDLEFTVSAGVTALFGPSGAGKTLVLDSIAGFVKPDEGRILLDDQILTTARRACSSLRKNAIAGMCFRTTRCFRT